MQRAEIIVHVKRVLLKHVTSIFNQSLYHRSLGKKQVYFYRLQRLHIQLVMLNIVFIANHRFLSSLRLLFDTLIGRSNTGVLPALLIKYRKQHSAGNAIILYVQEINFTRDNLVARSSSARVNIIVKYMYTLFEYKTKYQQEGIAKIKSMLFQAIAIFRLYVEKI